MPGRRPQHRDTTGSAPGYSVQSASHKRRRHSSGPPGYREPPSARRDRGLRPYIRNCGHSAACGRCSRRGPAGYPFRGSGLPRRWTCRRGPTFRDSTSRPGTSAPGKPYRSRSSTPPVPTRPTKPPDGCRVDRPCTTPRGYPGAEPPPTRIWTVHAKWRPSLRGSCAKGRPRRAFRLAATRRGRRQRRSGAADPHRLQTVRCKTRLQSL